MTYACRLLLPTRSFLDEITYVLDRMPQQMMEVKYLVPEIANKFNVPNDAVKLRLESLELTNEVISRDQLDDI